MREYLQWAAGCEHHSTASLSRPACIACIATNGQIGPAMIEYQPSQSPGCKKKSQSISVTATIFYQANCILFCVQGLLIRVLDEADPTAWGLSGSIGPTNWLLWVAGCPVSRTVHISVGKWPMSAQEPAVSRMAAPHNLLSAQLNTIVIQCISISFTG